MSRFHEIFMKKYSFTYSLPDFLDGLLIPSSLFVYLSASVSVSVSTPVSVLSLWFSRSFLLCGSLFYLSLYLASPSRYALSPLSISLLALRFSLSLSLLASRPSLFAPRSLCVCVCVFVYLSVSLSLSVCLSVSLPLSLYLSLSLSLTLTLTLTLSTFSHFRDVMTCLRETYIQFCKFIQILSFRWQVCVYPS